METPIPLFKPYFSNEEIEALREPFSTGWIGLGPKTAEFESRFASYIGAPYAVGLNSGTAALDLSMRILDIRHGDEVIVPTITFVSTAHAIVYNLATPIFADVDEKTLCIDIESVISKMTKRTKAVVPVHYGGRPVDIDALRKALPEPVRIIEDAAHACGAIYKGRKVGTLGDIACFSFHAVKNLAMGDGGAIVLSDFEQAEKAKRLRWLGINRSTWDRSKIERQYWWEYVVDEIGFKCHMNDIQASIGLVQLGKLDRMNQRRKVIAALYDEGFSKFSPIETPPKDDEIYCSSWHIYHIKAENRDGLSEYLGKNGITTGVHYKPIHTYKCYGNIPILPKAERTFKRILSLPMYPELTNEQVFYIIEKVKDFYSK